MAISAFNMSWLPPGRGLWTCGTNFVYERGSMALNNCAYLKIKDDIGYDIEFLMDALMLGTGVGFEPIRNDNLKLHNPHGFYDHIIPDTREGWAQSEQALIDAYTKPKRKEPRFIYDELREAGSPIKGFGGVASGPDPLKILHDQTRHFLIRYMQEKDYDSIRLKTDIANCVGCCVVAGNIRRSAELCLGKLSDQTFINLKDYNVFPDREAYGYMSNNACGLETDEDFENLDVAAVRLVKNAEPGIANLRNFPFGRIGKYNDIVKPDKGDGLNPCVPADQWILTDRGPRQVKELVGEQFLAIIDGHKYESTQYGFFRSGHKEVYEVETKEGYSFRCTKEHKILADYDSQKLYKPLSELKKGDQVTLHDHHKFAEWNGEGDWNEGYILGHLISDGCIPKNKRYGILYLYEDEIQHLPYLLSLLKGEVKVKESEEDSLQHRVTIKCDYLDELIEKYGLTSEKEIPDCIIETSSDFQQGFISGFFDTDGTVELNENEIRLSQSNYKRLQTVQLMLIHLGLKSVIYTVRKEHKEIIKGQEVICKINYALSIRGHNQLNYFRKYIGFQLTNKRLKLNQKITQHKRTQYNIDYFKATVKSINLVGIQDVYDCQIPNQNCISLNGVNVHNCGEIILEDYELCNLSQFYPQRCKDPEELFKAIEYATLYASTVSLLPTHKAVTNKVIARNRRIGVSVAGIIEWKKQIGVNKVIKYLRQAYHKVREINTWANEEAGVSQSIRVTTCVPGGTVTKVVGVYPAAYHPTFKYMIRRIRILQYSPMYFVLDQAGIPHEPDLFSANTEVFEYPIGPNDPTIKTEEEVSLWESANNLILMQREYADNSVSNTLKFKPKWVLKHHLTDPEAIQSYIEWVQELPEVKIVNGLYENIHVRIVVTQHEVKEYHYNPHHEENDVEPVLSSTVPMIKTMSMMPHTPKGVYAQMPEEGITKEEYLKRKAQIKKIDWSKYKGSSGVGEKYCQGDACELPQR